MKKNILFLLACIVFLYTGIVQASFSDPYDQGVMDPVSFFVVDDSNSSDPGSVVLSTSIYGLSGDYQLEYMCAYSGISDWTPLQTSTTLSTPLQGSAQVFLRLHNTVAGGVDTSGSLIFQGIESEIYFTTLIVDWGNVLSISTAANDDNLAPVPVPGTLWLLSFGILGIFGLRHR